MNWEQTLESAQKAALMQDGRRKVHYTFGDGKEMVEEYDCNSDELIIRKWRTKGTLGNAKPWEIEVGETAEMFAKGDSSLLESSTNPVFVRHDKVESFQWRIRNLPYPIDTYNISVENRQIVVRTSNKKYFKKISIPDLDRLQLEVDPAALTYAYANNTLIISYKKPIQTINFEKKLMTRLKKIKSEGEADQCKQQ